MAHVAVQQVGHERDPRADRRSGASSRTTSKSARESMFSISSGGSQDSGGWRYLRPRISASAQQGLPEAAVAVDEDAGARVAERVEALQGALDVGEVGDHVHEQDRRRRGRPPGRAAGGRPRRPRRSAGSRPRWRRGPPPPRARRRRCRRRAKGSRAASRWPEPQPRSSTRWPAGHARPQDPRQVVVEVAVAPPRALRARRGSPRRSAGPPRGGGRSGRACRGGALVPVPLDGPLEARPRSAPAARKPKSRSAREVSRQRRGWPSGLLGSQTDPSREAHEPGDRARRGRGS